MTRERLFAFIIDVDRNRPLAIVTLATLVCLPSLAELLFGQLGIASMLERYAFALLLATLGVNCVARVVVRYAARNALEPEPPSVAAGQAGESPISPE